MRIPALYAVAALLLTAHGATAQWTESVERPRFGASLFTGVRAPFNTGIVNFYGEEDNLLFSTQEQRGGNPVLGIEAEARIRGRVSAIGGITYSEGGIGEFFVDREPGSGDRGDFRTRYTSASWFAKAGASVRFEGSRRDADARPLPATEITVAPALVRQFRTNHPALNLGFEGSFPITGSRIGITAGLEDYLVFWNDDSLRPVALEALGPFGADAASAEFFYRTSHILVIRVGAALRF